MLQEETKKVDMNFAGYGIGFAKFLQDNNVHINYYDRLPRLRRNQLDYAYKQKRIAISLILDEVVKSLSF